MKIQSKTYFVTTHQWFNNMPMPVIDTTVIYVFKWKQVQMSTILCTQTVTNTNI